MNTSFSKLITASGFALIIPATSAGAATVAYWQLDEASGDLVDVVGTAQTLTGGSGLTYSQTNAAPNPVPNPDVGPFSSGSTSANPNSIGFSSATRAPKITDSAFEISSSSSFTFEGWVQHNINNGTQSGLEYIGGDRHDATGYNGWHLVLTSGKLQIFSQGTTITGTTAIDNGSAHHFAAVWDHDASGGEMRLYVDGGLEGTGSVTPVNYTGIFAVGGRNVGGDSLFNDNFLSGRLDELRFSDEALAPSHFLNVPEPGSLAILSLGILCVLRRRRD